MLISSITFKNFRNFKNSKFQFNPFLTVIIGENAQGKTNLLEGVYFLINGEGFRETKEEELIDLETDGHCNVEGVFVSGNNKSSYGITLVKREETLEKVFRIEKARKRYVDYVKGHTKTVLFSPDQIEIITGSPDRRREYFNRLLSIFDLEYRKKLRNFEQALRKRNKILESYGSIETLRQELSFWDRYLEEESSYITKKREEYVEYLNQNKSIDGVSFSMGYIKSELTRQRLQENLEREVRVRRTTIGPQKDDFQVALSRKGADPKNVHHFGSRSEQRFTIFWLKLNELRFSEDNFKKPLLLLDDIFSELDLKNKKLILNLIGKYQTIATTTEKNVLDLIEAPKSIIRL